MMPLKDLTEKRFGRLLVIERAESKDKKPRWLCLCDCGTTKILRGSDLNSKRTSSCGCLKKETQTKHGMVGTPEYYCWQDMLQRCNNKNDAWYGYYGGRGITVCDSWLDFITFFQDVGSRPGKGYSLDRIDNDKGYSPENCRWTIMDIQNRNQRIKKTNSSGIRGVGWSPSHKKHQAQIGVSGQNIHLGYFDLLEDAISARKAAEQKYWGEAAPGRAFQE